MTDEAAKLRCTVYRVLIVVAVAATAARVMNVERVYEPSLHRAAGDTSPTAPPRDWPKARPKPMPTFSSNDRSRWAMIRALVDDGTFAVGLRVRPCHANGRGQAHGGLLMTLCDIALGYRTATSVEPRPFLTTVSITADFAGSAKVGDWIEVHVDVQKVGRSLAFANCAIVCDGRRIVHASGVFAHSQAGQ